MRTLKAIGLAANAVAQILVTQVPQACSVRFFHVSCSCQSFPAFLVLLCRVARDEQVHPALEMLSQRLSHLHGLSRCARAFWSSTHRHRSIAQTRG